jgi:DHA1 family tetracycline resistance protein-like MFS transporter
MLVGLVVAARVTRNLPAVAPQPDDAAPVAPASHLSTLTTHSLPEPFHEPQENRP